MAVPMENVSEMNVGIPQAATLMPSFPNVEMDIKPSTSGIMLTPQTSTLYSPLPGTSTEQKRRSSSRSIKRKKFDDELVESSLVKTSRARPPSTAFPSLATPSYSPVTPLLHSVNAAGSSDQVPAETPITPAPEKKKPRPTPRRVKKPKVRLSNSQLLSTKDIGRWKPADDLTLVFAVIQTCNLDSVFRGVKFSCKFTLQEVKERWYTLLYDPTISKVAFNAMRQLHPDVVAQIQGKAMFSEAEEKLLSTIPSTAQVTQELFQELLDKNKDVFLPMRTVKILWNHWSLMKNYQLLPDQSPEKLNTHKFLGTYSDAEELINDHELQGPREEDAKRGMDAHRQMVLKRIRQVENELPKWQVLVDRITGVAPADFDNQTLAVLKGRYVRYLMRSREITIGRVTKDHTVDIDLSLEGPSSKVSRKQGIIRLENNGNFSIVNEGKRPFYVDGKPVINGSKYKLNNNSVLEITTLRFVFLVNQDLINTMKGRAGS